MRSSGNRTRSASCWAAGRLLLSQRPWGVRLDALSDPVSRPIRASCCLCGVGSSSLVFSIFSANCRFSARKKAEKPTGIYGEAASPTLQDCADAGLTDPNGLFLGLLRGVPLFFNGKAHLMTVAPARQGKGTSVVIPNLLHYPGSVFVTDPKGELAAVTARHRRRAVRAEGHLPQSVGTAWPAAPSVQPASAAHRDGCRSAPPSRAGRCGAGACAAS